MTLAISQYLNPNLEHFVACSKVWEGFLGSLPVPAAIYWPRHWAYWMRFWSSIRLSSLEFRWLEVCPQLIRMNNIHHHNHLYHSKERNICNNLFGVAAGDSWCGSLGRAGQDFSSVSWLDLVSIDFCQHGQALEKPLGIGCCSKNVRFLGRSVPS